jgi:hypothetical protein
MQLGQRERIWASRFSRATRVDADSGHTSAEAKVDVPLAQGLASAGGVRPLAGLGKIDDWLIVLDRSHGRARRRTLGPVP